MCREVNGQFFYNDDVLNVEKQTAVTLAKFIY